MHITGRDYTDEDLIAPWDPARRQHRPNRICDDPNLDDDREEQVIWFGDEEKPCQP